MPNEYPYVTRLDIKFSHLERIDVPAIVKECTEKWFNQTLTKVNEVSSSTLRTGRSSWARNRE
jgi:hypothetical protein